MIFYSPFVTASCRWRLQDYDWLTEKPIYVIACQSTLDNFCNNLIKSRNFFVLSKNYANSEFGIQLHNLYQELV